MQTGIDNSLSLLKQLQAKLQSNTSYASANNINQNYAHFAPKSMAQQPMRNFRTELPSYALNQHNQQFSYEQHVQGGNRSIPSTIPTKVQSINKNPSQSKKYKSISPKPLAQENKRLKKYITCLIKMNQYLKIQLAQRNRVQNIVQRKYVDSQIDLLKMEIQYLKQLNCDKQIEIGKYRKKLRSTSRKSKRSSSVNSAKSNNSNSCHKCSGHLHICKNKVKSKIDNVIKFNKIRNGKSPNKKNLKKKAMPNQKIDQKKR